MKFLCSSFIFKLFERLIPDKILFIKSLVLIQTRISPKCINKNFIITRYSPPPLFPSPPFTRNQLNYLHLNKVLGDKKLSFLTFLIFEPKPRLKTKLKHECGDVWGEGRVTRVQEGGISKRSRGQNIWLFLHV